MVVVTIINSSYESGDEFENLDDDFSSDSDNSYDPQPSPTVPNDPYSQQPEPQPYVQPEPQREFNYNTGGEVVRQPSYTNPENHSAGNSVDEELEKLLSQKKAKIKVLGTGGAGNNTVSRITEIGIVGAETIVINTDAQDLLSATADKKLLIGKELTSGLGAGSNPNVGKEAAKESEQDIKNLIKGAHMIFITAGLGGGTGGGSIPVIASLAKKMGILTVGIVTIPFTMEGKLRHENAMNSLEELEGNVDTLIVIPNDKLIELAPDLPLHTAFKVADEILTNAVKGIAELITKPGLINLDFADIKAVMSSGGIAMIGVGESDTENRAIECVEKALQNPLLDVEVSGANGALINVVGGANMTLDEAEKVVKTVTSRLDDSAKIIWGAQLAPDLQNTVRVMLVIVGVKSSQIFGPKRTFSDKRKDDLADDLGIKFVD